MIYECPQCRMPQEAGQIVCPHCHAEFDGPVPDDAIVPQEAPAAPASPTPIPAAEPRTEAGPIAVARPISEARPIAVARPASEPLQGQEAASPLEEVKPPAAASQPYLTAPSFSPSSFLPPAESPISDPRSPMRQPFTGLSRMLLIAFPVVLVLIFGSIYFVNSLNTGSEATPPPTAAPPPVSIPAASVPVGSPMYLQGGTNTNNVGDNTRAKNLVGHWESKSGDDYVFNDNGTGSRSSAANPQKDQSFLWGLVQNRLMLYMAKNETLRFNPGPNDNTIFLGAQTGHYIQYTRSKT
jgi:uncharacterized Zn finger protein (UPF0148 family)